MIEIQRLLRFRLGLLYPALVLVAISVLQPASTTAAQQQAYESPPVLSTSKILPPELVSGPHHRVQEAVNNNGYFNIYQIDSKFGTFTAREKSTI